MNQSAIEIKQLEKRFPKFHLGPLDLNVPSGAIYGLVGPNGAGKTTTLDLLFGMGSHDAGSMSLLGLNPDKNEVELKQRVAYVSPDLNYQIFARVDHAIRFLTPFYPSWDQDFCDELLKRFRIDPKDKIAALSFGNRIKLSLALAFARRPELLILDEPTVGLDAGSKREVFSQLLTLLKNGENTVVISSHSLSDLERFTDHLGVINEGKLILEGPTDSLLQEHRHLDFTLNGTLPHGGKVVSRDGTRFRVLSDDAEAYEKALVGLGANDINVSPVTLEDLFLGLVEGE